MWKKILDNIKNLEGGTENSSNCLENSLVNNYSIYDMTTRNFIPKVKVDDPSDDRYAEKVKELIQAAMDSDKDKVKALLDAGADPHGRDVFGRTALHWAATLQCPCTECGQNSEVCLKMILMRTKDVDAQDNDGLTALHIAAENQLEKSCKMLLFFGADVHQTSKSGESALTLIAKKVPEVIVYLLDESVTLDGMFPTSEKCRLLIDFRTILGSAGNPKKSVTCTLSERCHKVCPCAGRNELHLLRSLLNSSKLTRKKIFTHPAVTIFLDQKWNRVRKYFWATFLCYVFWLLMYTGYILMVYLISCPCPFFGMDDSTSTVGTAGGHEKHFSGPVAITVNLTGGGPALNRTTINGTNLSEEEFAAHRSKCLEASTMNGAFLVLLVSTIIMGLNEVIKILTTPKLYLQSRLNIMHWILVVMALVTFYPTFANQDLITSQQYQIAALTIFLAWSLILSQVGKFPSVGNYMEIFGHVLRHFWSFLLCYCSLFVAFALAFSILFPGNQPYTIFPFAFLKIFVMMVGEMEYQEKFYQPSGGISGPFVGHILYATFVIVVAIVLMNLLIGLTVYDIRGLQKEAEMSRVSRQILDMFHLESFLFSDKIPMWLKNGIYKMTSVAVQVELQASSVQERPQHSMSTHSHETPLLPNNKFVFKFLPNDSRDKSVPETMKAAAFELASKTQHEKKERVCLKRKMIQTYFGRTEPPSQANNPISGGGGCV